MIYGNLSSFQKNIVNKNMQDGYYSEASPSDTGLIILVVQPKDSPAYLLCFLLEIISVAIR